MKYIFNFVLSIIKESVVLGPVPQKKCEFRYIYVYICKFKLSKKQLYSVHPITGSSPCFNFPPFLNHFKPILILRHPCKGTGT
jgi:hypothetical protein